MMLGGRRKELSTSQEIPQWSKPGGQLCLPTFIYHLRGVLLSVPLNILQPNTKFLTPSPVDSFLQELLKGMDAHKSEVLSINLSSADFLQTEPDSEEAWELRDGLKEMNARWDRLGSSLEDWREELQRALMRCQVLRLICLFRKKKQKQK